MIIKRFASLKDSWPSAFVARGKVEEFSGGILNPRSMANADCAGIGPEGRIKIGRKVAYTVEALIAYMESRVV